MAIVAPSILSADFSKLLEEVQEVEQYGAKYLHVDVMDGHFVPNISLGAVVYAHLKGKVDMVFDVHIMIAHPEKYAKTCIDAGADILTFHYEATKDVKGMIDLIHSLGANAGISIKPETDIRVLDPYLKDLDLVLVMSVEPGFGGQSFMRSSLEKLAYLKEAKVKNTYTFSIEVDGGINLETGKECVDKGAEILVAGSYIFGHKNRKDAVEGLKRL